MATVIDFPQPVELGPKVVWLITPITLERSRRPRIPPTKPLRTIYTLTEVVRNPTPSLATPVQLLVTSLAWTIIQPARSMHPMRTHHPLLMISLNLSASPSSLTISRPSRNRLFTIQILIIHLPPQKMIEVSNQALDQFLWSLTAACSMPTPMRLVTHRMIN